jgi:TPP-dependent pyruvate/acetoin dehydrogenase alpha subunit
VELDAINAEIKQEMVEAIRFAQESPQPDPATAMDYIYA